MSSAQKSSRSLRSRLFVLSSVVGIGGYIGGLFAATQLEAAAANLVRAASIGFSSLVMAMMREMFGDPRRRGDGAVDANSAVGDWSLRPARA